MNKDQSVDGCMRPEAPKNEESYWMPAVRRSNFSMLFRFQETGDAIFTKAWQLKGPVFLASARKMKISLI